MRITLEIVAGPAAGRRLEVAAGQNAQVGRNPPADLVIPEDALLSNVHFRLEWEGAACRLRDLGSRFGTTVNGNRVTEAVLADGDRIVAGQTSLLVRATSPAPAKEPPPSAPATAQAPAAPAPPAAGGGWQDRLSQVLSQ